MVTKMRKLNAGGFSLVELMVVVAIIGILASVAIPNFQKFQRKARRSEGQSLSSSMRTGLEALTAEWDSYSSDLVLAGLRLTGGLNFHCGVGVFDSPTYTKVAPEYVEVPANSVTSVAAVLATGGAAATVRACAPTAADMTMTRTTYQVACCGDIGGAALDRFRISSTGALGVVVTSDGTL